MAQPRKTPPDPDASAFEKAVEAGRRSLDQGRRIPYEKVRRWLLSWGTDRQTPPPECE